LTAAELTRFRTGRAEFWRKYDVATGLGPHYNDTGCVSCHSEPAVGGAAGMEKAARVVFQPPDFVEVWPIKAIAGFEPLRVPKTNVITFRRPTLLMGLGLLEAIPDEAVAAHCSQPATADGVRYKLNRAWNGRPGRFGSKAHNDTILDFAASAITSEMGITNPLKRDPRFRADKDNLPDPEVPAARIEALADFVRFLAPPPRDGVHIEGEKIFATLGCTACHTPTPHPAAPGVYSDLCLHDMGKALDARQPDFLSTGAEWRTAPLWGVRWKNAYLHDERAKTLDEAILAHGGEGQKITKPKCGSSCGPYSPTAPRGTC
jgi:CxxC motif-containing protein (DUF1111 family)